jgi:hypothetical protein
MNWSTRLRVASSDLLKENLSGSSNINDKYLGKFSLHIIWWTDVFFLSWQNKWLKKNSQNIKNAK